MSFDLRTWIESVDEMGKLRRIEGADPKSEIGVLAELNGQRRGPTLLFDTIRGYAPGYRLLTSAVLDAQRMAFTLNLPTDLTTQGLVDTLETGLIDYERRARDFAPQEVENGPVLECCQFGDDVDLYQFPAPTWHEGDGGPYIGTGCNVITQDPDSGTVNLGAYRVMLQDRNTVTVHAVPGHHGSIHIRKWHERGKPAPVAVSLGHHPLFLLIGGMSVPYEMSEYQYVGAVANERVPVVRAKVTGLPINAFSELVIDGWIHPGDYAPEGPFGEYTGYYASGRGPSELLRVEAVYHRTNPIVLGAMPCRPPHDYSYFLSLLKSANVRASLKREGILDVRGVWYHEVAGVNFFVVISVKQRYPGHAKQVGYFAAQCRPAGASLGRYYVVVDEDIDPSDLDAVLWAIGTRSDPAKDIDVLHNTFSNDLDPIVRKNQRGVYFGNRAVIDATRPFDWLDEFPPVASATEESKRSVREKWAWLFSGRGGE